MLMKYFYFDPARNVLLSKYQIFGIFDLLYLKQITFMMKFNRIIVLSKKKYSNVFFLSSLLINYLFGYSANYDFLQRKTEIVFQDFNLNFRKNFIVNLMFENFIFLRFLTDKLNFVRIQKSTRVDNVYRLPSFSLIQINQNNLNILFFLRNFLNRIIDFINSYIYFYFDSYGHIRNNIFSAMSKDFFNMLSFYAYSRNI